MMKQIPYGLTDFARIQKDNYYYVDKTMFIERIEMQPGLSFSDSSSSVWKELDFGYVGGLLRCSIC